MKKIVLAAINAKFIHSNAAIFSLIAHCPQDITPLEFTVNDNFNFILSEIYATAPTVLGLSCYIWNIRIIEPLVAALKKVLPNTQIILGGPEVSFNAADVLQKCPADIVVVGEGEETLREILSGQALATVRGIVYRTEKGEIYTNPPREKSPMENLAFPYNIGNLPQNKIIYYEASRGCPFSCGYCLSHNEKPVRFLPLPRVLEELQFFLNRCVNQVKFTDRTFNCDRKRAMQIWQFLIENDNQHTNFHFEIAADLLDKDAIRLLRNAPEGLFQFEIGVQSTHEETLKHIQRDTNTQAAMLNIQALKECPTIHIHLDLIAGLPAESYETFARSFNAVYALMPDMLQLGFLKLLKGVALRENAEAHGIVYNDAPPYEVLYTRHISYQALTRLKAVESALDMLYNSGNFKQTLRYVQTFYATPFHFYEAFARYWQHNGYHRMSQSLATVCKIFTDFAQPMCNEKIFNNLLKFDWYAAGNQKNPPWLDAPTKEDFEIINTLYKRGNTSKRCPIVKFDFDPREGACGNAPAVPVYLQFDPPVKPRLGAQIKNVNVTVVLL
ncbi:MAG: B12-binding domain-containing radical SAM protein [Defluviitaleaceae bacterium]|nr:B12-binding domain-containing radical SAM protein [Defluviitaleaceae bacterium]MCL2275529.1 B12-binding domain-containing radical SAM protein [Defluviitaleaceae bacterium]